MTVELTNAQARDLLTISENKGRGGVAARTGSALYRLGLVMSTPGYRAHGARRGWMTTAKGEAVVNDLVTSLAGGK